MIMNADMISSRGFLKGDKALGQVQVKLTPFDNKCEIHDCFDVSVNLVYSLIDVFMVDPNIKSHILHTVLCTFPKEPDLYVQIVYKYIYIFFFPQGNGYGTWTKSGRRETWSSHEDQRAVGG